MSKVLLSVIAAASAGTYVETHQGSAFVRDHGSQIATATPAILIGVGFWALVHGMKVGQGRAKYAELARKDGEKDVDERYLLPNLYAQGTSKHVRAFNCLQRSHQHIFETYHAAIVGGLAAAAMLPVCAAVFTLVYAAGRYQLSNGYAKSDGDPLKRYKYPLARFMWYGLLGNIFLGLTSCGLLASGRKGVFWL